MAIGERVYFNVHCHAFKVKRGRFRRIGHRRACLFQCPLSCI